MAVFSNPDSAAILWDNFLSTASIVSAPSNISPLTPITNALVQNRNSIILLTNNSGGSIVFDLGSARRPSVIALVDANGVTSGQTSAQQWVLYGADDSGFTTNMISWVFPIYSQSLTRYYLGPDKLAGYKTFSESNDLGVGIALSTDNKIYVASGISGYYRQIRFTYDGRLNTAYGSGTGYTDSGLPGTSEIVLYMFGDSNGKRVTIGTSLNGSDTQGVISRVSDDGTFDTSFDTNGYKSFSVSSDVYTYPTGIDQQSTGHYVAFGHHGASSSTPYGFFYRVSSTGSSPTSLTDISPTGSTFTSIQCVVDGSDRPIGLGYTAASFTDVKMTVWRTDSSITALDTTFNTTGKFEYQYPLSDSVDLTIPTSLDVQSSNKIVVAATAYQDNPTYGNVYGVWTALRIRSSTGVIDGSFSTNGKFVYDWGGHSLMGFTKVLSDDSIILSGQGYDNGLSCLAFIKLTSEGAIDSSFGTGGVTKILSGGISCQSKYILELSDGKLLVTGYFTDSSSSSKTLFILRLNANGTLDSTFSPTSPNGGRRYWKLKVGTTNNSPAHCKIGYIFLGDYTDIRPDTGTSISIKDDTDMFEARSGAMYGDIKKLQRESSLTLKSITKDELKTLRSMMNEVGNDNPIILDLFANTIDSTEATNGLMYGYFSNKSYFTVDLQTAQTDNVKLKITESPE